VLFAVVLLASKAAVIYLGEGGTYLMGVVAGTTDVDAVTLSMTKLAQAGLTSKVAATTILLAVASNTVVKAAMSAVVGGWRLGRYVAPAFGAMLVTGAAGTAALWLL